MKKSNKGITLIALIVSIIILFILSAISISAIIGENGIVAKARESSIVTAIADAMFNLEDNIVDINIDNIGKEPKFTSAEMIKELTNRGQLYENNKTFLEDSIVMQSEVKKASFRGLNLGYNGDLWFENYKRGKIQLSQQVQTVYSSDKKKKVTVIDGTVGQVIADTAFLLCALDNRNDFLCWVNQYGEVISQYPNTVVYVVGNREEEYVALYNKELRKKVLTNSGVFIGYQSYISKDPSGILICEFQATHNYYSHYYINLDYETLKANIVGHLGIGAFENLIFLSDDYNNLINHEEILDNVKNNKIKGYTSEIKNKSVNAVEELKGSLFSVINIGNVKYPAIYDYNKLVYSSVIDVGIAGISLNEEYINSCKEKGIKRLYYRGGISFGVMNTIPELNADGTCTWTYLTDDDGEVKKLIYYESAIKYIDL